MTDARTQTAMWLRPYGPLILFCLLACGMAASTYSVFGHTWDEPEHLAAGIALLDTGEYPYDQQHPPLARVAMAIGPFLAGAHSHGNAGPSGEQEGRDILYGEGHYDRYLTLARIGMLPFLLALIIATWLWTRMLFDELTAHIAAALVVLTPVIIGHAAVAALDVPMVGTSMVALYLMLKWFTQPSFKGAIGFGLATGIAAGTKLSSIPFIGIVAIVWFVFATLAPTFFPNRSRVGLILAGSNDINAERDRLVSWTMLQQAVLAAFAGGIALLACFGFIFEHVVASFRTLLEHNQSGHLSYFMGELRRTGWWDFYIVELTVKTPIPLLIAGLLGTLWLMWKAVQENRWMLATPALAWLAVIAFASAYSHINIGIRHVLLVFPILAINAAALLAALARRKKIAYRALGIGAISAQALITAFAHPDYLAYFNAFAGSHPEKIVVDSDLDWGQDLRRLKKALNERKIEHFSFVFRGTADLQREGFPDFEFLWPHKRATGWVAVSLLAKATGSEDGGYDWIDDYHPIARIGKSIDLYYIEK